MKKYKQVSMMRAIGDQVSVMNKLLNDALRAKDYAGPDIKMVLTDVEDTNGPYYTDTLTNTVVFDRTMLAKSNRDQILNALGHEFGHYSKEDNKTGTQTIANYSGEKLEDRTKGMVAKEATEDTLAAIRNNKNVITGEEGKKLADSIPMDRREYYTSEVYFSTSEASLIRMAQSYSKYTSYSTDTVTEYSIGNMDVGAGTPDLSISAGVGLYAADTPEELMKLTNSYGGSTDVLGITVGVDVIYKPLEKYKFLSFLNVKGIKLYGGIGVPILKAEGHVSIKNFGKVMNEKKYKTLEYYKNKSLPYNIRQYYQYNYKLEEKSDRK
ncbi:hemolysin [Fusobacterium polymorphum]|uniref:Hemolysin n=1 Tax=Fusobacterium nucleatum subsp. polymorphum TaxID=76857 RepID=A0A246EFM7_FUSNP|nr:M48 family metalloprotease [Fusobacterium polymorphum]OWP25456.1 hemolysin [Fusobacterium polymorphum]